MLENDFLIRVAEPKDAIELREVCAGTFYDTFVGTCTQEDMKNYLEKTFPYSRIMEEINSPHANVYLVVLKEKICGYAKMGSQIISELKDRKAIEIERLYVLKEYIGKGLGRQLMKKFLQN